jgi:hypothetical protein
MTFEKLVEVLQMVTTCFEIDIIFTKRMVHTSIILQNWTTSSFKLIIKTQILR